MSGAKTIDLFEVLKQSLAPKPLATHALSVHAPWAWAIMFGGKAIENRSAKFRGRPPGERVWIHASKSPKPDRATEGFQLTIRSGSAWGELLFMVARAANSPDLLKISRESNAMRGHIIGSVLWRGPHADASRSQWYVPGSVGFGLSDPQPLREFVTARGQLGFWRPDVATMVRLEGAA